MERILRVRRARRVQTWATLAVVFLGPVLALITFLMLGPLDRGANSIGLRNILLADMVYIIIVAGLVVQRLVQMIAARRRRSAGSQLHLRLTGVFALVALLPTILVAVFAALSVNTGLEGWFSDRVRSVVGSSLEAAQAYETQQSEALVQDIEAMANALNRSRQVSLFVPLRQTLGQVQSQIQRGLKEAYVIDGAGEIQARGERSYLFDFEQPSLVHLGQAEGGETVLIGDWEHDEYRALIRLSAFPDSYLLVSRSVDGQILTLLDETEETAKFYQELEQERGRLLFDFGLLYIGFAVILILAAVWLGLWFAERLSRPVGRLAGAAQRVGAGDLDVRVVEESGDDEIAMLGRIFNQMTRQLKGQRDALLTTNRQIETRRRLFDSVLSSVTAGVIGLDADGRLAFLNKSAISLLDLEDVQDNSLPLRVAVPEFEPLFDKLFEQNRPVAQGEVKLTRYGKQENLLVRMAMRRTAEGELEGYVIAFDDVTDLVSAQRMAAWGDVARRIAHEIKNPLTPIQLSAERIKRKFTPMVGENVADLEQYTDVIVRKTNDLRHIVDEFSKFARMPEPNRKPSDLVQLVRDAVVLQEAGQPGVQIVSNLPDDPIFADLDDTMIAQALTNLIKNAGEATESLMLSDRAPDRYKPEIRVQLLVDAETARITVEDNGVGLPEDRSRLFEPYVTTRDSGTGLGLPIVRKIIEEHGGTLRLLDAPAFEPATHSGACAEIVLPIAATEQFEQQKQQAVS